MGLVFCNFHLNEHDLKCYTKFNVESEIINYMIIPNFVDYITGELKRLYRENKFVPQKIKTETGENWKFNLYVFTESEFQEIKNKIQLKTKLALSKKE